MRRKRTAVGNTFFMSQLTCFSERASARENSVAIITSATKSSRPRPRRDPSDTDLGGARTAPPRPPSGTRSGTRSGTSLELRPVGLGGMRRIVPRLRPVVQSPRLPDVGEAQVRRAERDGADAEVPDELDRVQHDRVG